jgi:hypothetical protein
LVVGVVVVCRQRVGLKNHHAEVVVVRTVLVKGVDSVGFDVAWVESQGFSAYEGEPCYND